MTEKEWIHQLKEDSRQAFDEVYRLYSARLYAYCLQYTKVREDAEEIVQDVFIKLWMYRKRIRSDDTLRYLIFRMAKNQLINAYKARLNSFAFEEYVNQYNQEKASVDDTHHAVEYDDFCRALERAMNNLSDNQRKVIAYAKFEQLSNQEVAKKLRLKEQTVKNLLSTGLKKLRSDLKRYLFWLGILLFVK